MMKLFFHRATRATRPRWLIEEANLPVEIVPMDLAAGEHKTPEFRKLHPHNKLPVLVDGDTAIIESAAICLYLADRFPQSGLAPPAGTHERGPYYQWVVYAMVTLEPHVGTIFGEQRKPEGERDDKAIARAREHLDAALRVLSDQLADREWLTGRFSTADIVTGSILAWAASLKLTSAFPVIEAYVARCKARPAFARART
jgi:glutathione S-transferase